MATTSLNPGVGPTNADIATAVAAPSAATIATAVAAAVPTNASITTIAQANGGVPLKQYASSFTSSGNWTAPNNTNAVKVFLVGGGGGGGNNDGSNNSFNGGGGGGGVVIERTVPVTPGTNYAITIGGGGAQGSTGAQGGTSNFGNLLSAIGGGGGAGASYAMYSSLEIAEPLTRIATR